MVFECVVHTTREDQVSEKAIKDEFQKNDKLSAWTSIKVKEY